MSKTLRARVSSLGKPQSVCSVFALDSSLTQIMPGVLHLDRETNLTDLIDLFFTYPEVRSNGPEKLLCS